MFNLFFSRAVVSLQYLQLLYVYLQAIISTTNDNIIITIIASKAINSTKFIFISSVYIQFLY